MIFDFDSRSSDSPLVQSIWRSRSEGGGSFISTAVSQWEMVVTRQWDQLTLSVRGPETGASSAPVPEDVEFFGIIFKHGVFMPRLPKSELVDQEIHLRESLNNAFQFLGTTWQFPTFENADTFISRLVNTDILSFDPIVEDVLHGQVTDLSQRSIQRRFLHVTGLTHKTIQQIERARQASALLQGGTPIIETAYQTGYFDQAHLTNALRRFYGQTPAQIAHQAQIHSGVFFQDADSLKLYNQINNNQKENR
jgi:AraC-like DNA-binding protein